MKPDQAAIPSGSGDLAGLPPADPSGFRPLEATSPRPAMPEKPLNKADDNRAKELLQQYIDMMNRQQAAPSGAGTGPSAGTLSQGCAGAPSGLEPHTVAPVQGLAASASGPFAGNLLSATGVAPQGCASLQSHFGNIAQGPLPTGHPPQVVMAGPMGAKPPMPGMTMPGLGPMPGMMMPGMMMAPGMLPMGALPPPPTGPPMGPPPPGFGGPLPPHAGPWLLSPGVAALTPGMALPPGAMLPPGATVLPPGVALPPGAVAIGGAPPPHHFANAAAPPA